MVFQKEDHKTSIFFWRDRQRLVFLGKEPSPSFWDEWWENEDLKKAIRRSRKSRYWQGFLSKYLPEKNSRILEGGCGDGHLVDAMKYWGYASTGVDFAASTVEKINEAVPDLDVRCGDVRKLDFEDGYFDGYLSLGVIEHFWEGYESILSEMNRVLKPGGYVFLSFPSISMLDKLQIVTGRYKLFHETEKPSSFYQFGLDNKTVKNDFLQMGFEYITSQRKNGLLGVERFCPNFKKVNQKLRCWSQKTKVMRILYYATTLFLSPLCGHSVLIVFRKPTESIS